MNKPETYSAVMANRSAMEQWLCSIQPKTPAPKRIGNGDEVEPYQKKEPVEKTG